jgi:hypothetical protein
MQTSLRLQDPESNRDYAAIQRMLPLHHPLSDVLPLGSFPIYGRKVIGGWLILHNFQYAFT